MGQGKGRDTIDRFFNDWMSQGQKARVAWASCDMSPAYIGAITHHCPNVTLVIDRFHLVKALNQAVDEVRKEQWRALDTQGRKANQGPAVAAQPALPASDPGPYPVPQQLAELESAHSSRVGAQGRI